MNLNLAKFLFSYLLILSCSIHTVSAQTNNDQRKIFKEAEKHVWQAHTRTYKNLYNQLHYYPLQPYLDQRRLLHKIKLSDAAEIETFLDKYRGTPLDWPLRKNWLKYLAKRKRKSLFLKFFKPNTDAMLNCTKLSYQLDAGMPKQPIFKAVEPLWLVGKSQHKTCDKVFKQWIAADNLTPSLVWRRLALAADGGKHTLIPYLTSLLPKEEQYLGKLWHKVRRDPAKVSKAKYFPNKNKKETQILYYGLKRLIWRDPDLAIKTYNNISSSVGFTDKQKKQLVAKFAIALASKNHKQAPQWLAKVDDSFLSENMVQWQLAQLLREQNWQDINQLLSSLPQKIQETSQWQYWHGRSQIALGNKEQGENVLAELAKRRHYYGFLAASKLELPISLQNQPLKFTQQEKNRVLENDSAKRAFELFHLQRFSHARKEWNYWLSKLNKNDKLVAASIAFDNGWFDRPIFTLAQQGYLNDVDLRFPIAYENHINKYAKKADIDASWALAITRRESSFMADAHSSAGAKGLMQLMPQTAKQLARRSVSTKYILKADNNIHLGTKYLKKLLDQYQGNAVLATASYNAGPHRVRKWISKLDNMPADIWIETIPFKETREYVKSVMAYQQIYQHKTGAKHDSPFESLVNMQITP